jgi:UDP-4-amino-4,6-dideoxy-N-acetyl-beta-L-altrosamine transaminase
MDENIIPYGKQNITEDDILAVISALKGDYLTQGPTILEFELEFSKYIGCKYSVAVSNGTAALHLAALSLQIKPGDKVITTPITFAASANCIRYCGGEVVFSDIDPITYLLDLDKVEELLNLSPKGTYTGIIAVDFAGKAIDLERLRRIANEFDCWIIEDACHAPGGFFIDSNGYHQNCGNGKFADLSVFSFHPVKHIATGEGGMITTNDQQLYFKLLELRSHGITRNSNKFENSIEFANGSCLGEKNDFPGWYMEMQHLGFNYRFTDFQAALGISQLKRANIGLIKRKNIAKAYFEAFQNKSYILGQSGIDIGHAYHLYIIEVIDRRGLYDFLKTKGIHAQIHYIPCHLMPYYKNLTMEMPQTILDKSENYYSKCISLPIFPTLSLNEVDYVIAQVNRFYE